MSGALDRKIKLQEREKGNLLLWWLAAGGIKSFESRTLTFDHRGFKVTAS
jgi:hypothetical protein